MEGMGKEKIERGEKWKQKSKKKEKKRKKIERNRKKSKGNLQNDIVDSTICEYNYYSAWSSEMSIRLGLVCPLGSAYTLPSQVQAEEYAV